MMGVCIEGASNDTWLYCPQIPIPLRLSESPLSEVCIHMLSITCVNHDILEA